MANKTILWFCAGTWQSYGSGTNIQRLYDSVLRIDKFNNKVVKFYDSGIGSSGPDTFRKLAAIFGIGLSNNIIDAYLTISKLYRPGDRIMLFGYSRGAFAARCIAGIIARFGLMDVEALNLLGPRAQRKSAKRVLNRYRSNKPQAIEITGHNNIDFIGVFDTVNSVGIPINAVRNIVDKIWQKLFKRRLWGLYDNKLSSKVTYGVQALAIDETRGSFQPEVWQNAENVKQTWFPGSHTDIKGGLGRGQEFYPLLWMVKYAEIAGLKFDNDAVGSWVQAAHTTSPLYDSRSTLFGKLSTYKRRNAQYGNVHNTVYERIKGVSGYFPTCLYPKHYPVLSEVFPELRKRIWFIQLLLALNVAGTFIYNSIYGVVYELPQWLQVVSVVLPDVNQLSKIFASWTMILALTLFFGFQFFRKRILSAEKEYSSLVWRNHLKVKNNGYQRRHVALMKRIRTYQKLLFC